MLDKEQSFDSFKYVWDHNGCHGELKCKECIFHQDKAGCIIDFIHPDFSIHVTLGQLNNKQKKPSNTIDIWDVRDNIRNILPKLIKDKTTTKEEAFIIML